MTFDLDIAWWVFAPACLALNLSPGPNNLASFVNGARLPLGAAVLAGFGRLPAFAGLIILTAVGLGAAIAASAWVFWTVKILGAIYLIYIGVKLWRAPTTPLDAIPRAGFRAMARRDFLLAIGNPKAIAIFTAFFPQFIDPAGDVSGQILALGVVFLALEASAATAYAVAGRSMRGAFRRVGGFGALQKGVGGFLIVSGVAMAASQR